MKRLLLTLFHGPRLAAERGFDACFDKTFPFYAKYPEGGGCWLCGCPLPGAQHECFDCYADRAW